MTAPGADSDFRNAWQQYVEAIRSLLQRKHLQPNRQYLREIESWQEDVLEAVTEPHLVEELERGWTELRTMRGAERAASLFLAELRQMPPIADGILARAQESVRPAASSARIRDGLNAGKTMLDSLLDLLDSLPFGIKAILKIFGELLDIMKGA